MPSSPATECWMAGINPAEFALPPAISPGDRLERQAKVKTPRLQHSHINVAMSTDGISWLILPAVNLD
jgi:hypothetical protein